MDRVAFSQGNKSDDIYHDKLKIELNRLMLGLTFIDNFIRIKPINGLYRKKWNKRIYVWKKRVCTYFWKSVKSIYEQEFHIGICQSYARNSTIAPWL